MQLSTLFGEQNACTGRFYTTIAHILPIDTTSIIMSDLANGARLASDSPRIVIVGAGIAGITMATNLKAKLHFTNFVVYEKAPNVGGTWRDNTYPGCGSDVPGHWYSLSTELNPHWENYYISQPEIQGYWMYVFRKHNISSHTIFNTQVNLVEWDEHANVHRLTLVDSVSGQTTHAEAEIVISAVGAFMSPLFPKNVPGVENFRGPFWHSFRWRHDVDLKNKRVGVIGNGCSVAQFLPIISEEQTTEVINFCRSPQWFVIRGQYKYPEWIKWAFAHVPLLMRAYRASIMIRSDLTWFIYKNSLPFGKIVRMFMIKYLKDTAPADSVDRMIPDYPPGCKRIIVDPGYLAALHRPNVQLKWDTIQEIVEDGVVLCTGEKIPLDVIIFGTGFYLVDRDVSFRGLNGITLDQYFESEGGAAGYYGTVFPGFPNAFTIVGPNSASGHASLLFTIELQIDYILKLITPVIAGEFKALKVREEATKKYNTWIRERMENTIFLSCFSYYRGDDRRGSRNIATFPGMLTLYWWKLRRPRWADYEVLQGGGWVGRGPGEVMGKVRRWIWVE